MASIQGSDLNWARWTPCLVPGQNCKFLQYIESENKVFLRRKTENDIPWPSKTFRAKYPDIILYPKPSDPFLGRVDAPFKYSFGFLLTSDIFHYLK